MATASHPGTIDAFVVLTYRGRDEHTIYCLEGVSFQEEVNRDVADYATLRNPLSDAPSRTITIEGGEGRLHFASGISLPGAMSGLVSEVYKERDEAKREAGELRQRVYRLEDAMRNALELASSILDPEDRDDTECFDSDY